MSRDSGTKTAIQIPCPRYFPAIISFAPIPNVLLNPLHIESFFYFKIFFRTEIVSPILPATALLRGNTASRTLGHPRLHSGTRLAALRDTPGFIPGHTVIRQRSSSRSSAGPCLKYGLILPEIQRTPQKIPRQSACRQLVTPPRSDFTSSSNEFPLHPQSHFNASRAYYRTVNKPNLEDLT